MKPRSSSLPPLPTIDVSQSITASPSLKKVSPAKWRWAKIGCVIGLILGVINIVLIRNGKAGTANASEAIGYFIGFFGVDALLGGLVGFVAGVIRDFFASRPVAGQPIIAKRSHPVTEQQTHKTSKLNVISMHWRGLYPLWVSYWVISVAANIFLFVVAALVADAFALKSGYNPLAAFATMASIWFCILAVVIWQVVGVWRSANAYTAKRLSIGQKAPWAVIAKIALSFGIIKLVATFASSGLPQLSETTRMAFMGDPDIPDYSLQIMRNGTEAEITGGLKYGLTDDFMKLLRASPQISVVHLNAHGRNEADDLGGIGQRANSQNDH